MRKIPYLVLICLFASFGTRAQLKFDQSVLSYVSNGTPVNGVKIITNLPFTNGSQMPTLVFEGYAFRSFNSGPFGTVNFTLNYYIYDNVFVNYGASSSGSYMPVIKLANEGNKVVIFIESRDYFLRFNVRAYVSGGLTAETVTNFTGWTTQDAALTGTGIVTVPYMNAFGGRVAIAAPTSPGSVPTPQAALHVMNAVPSGGDGIAAIFGSGYRHFTHFGGPNGGRIRGADQGYLVLESNPNGSNKILYLNLESSGNVMIASGGGNVVIGSDAANPSTNPQYKLQVNGTIGARKVKVTQETWADDALRPAYHLPTLPELAAFIRQNGHLPGIPSEKEVQSEGIDVGEMDSRLLRKIEELTLYIIKQDEENAAMRKSLEEINRKLQKLEKASGR